MFKIGYLVYYILYDSCSQDRYLVEQTFRYSNARYLNVLVFEHFIMRTIYYPDYLGIKLELYALTSRV